MDPKMAWNLSVFARITAKMTEDSSYTGTIEPKFPQGTSSPRPHDSITGTVFNIMRYCQHDGPGIRTVVFLKGCPLRCLWCHNPEGLDRHPEIAFVEARCIKCGECFAACPNGAVERVGDGFRIVDEICEKCGTCVETCYSDARQLVGKEMTAADVLKEVEKDAVYYDISGGGVTFSGGEPLLQQEFLLFLLTALRERGIHSAIETCGHTLPELLRQVSERTDLFLYDIKMMDERLHRKHTGVSNVVILENLKHLSSWGAQIIVRVPVIPGVNDNEENTRLLAKFLDEETTVKEVHLLPFHAIGKDKYRRLRKDYRLPEISEIPRMEPLVEILNDYEIRTVIGG